MFVADDVGSARRAVERVVAASPGLLLVARRGGKPRGEVDVLVSARGRPGTAGVVVPKAAWLAPGAKGGAQQLVRAIQAAARRRVKRPAAVVKAPARRPSSRDRDRARAAELNQILRTISGDGAGVLRQVVAALPELLDTDQACLSEAEYGLPPRFRIVGANFDARRLEEVVNPAFADGRIVDLLGWNPANPEPSQRNVAVTKDLREDEAREPEIVAQYPRIGLTDRHQLRTLVCDGDELLAYVGVWRAAPFGQREVSLLEAIVPALRDRMRLERRLGRAGADAATLAVALEAMPGEAFVVRTGGTRLRVEAANAPGRAWLTQDRADVERELRAGLQGTSDRLTGHVIESAGNPGLWLMARRTAGQDASLRLHSASARYGLTPRQAEVLGVLARGASNKDIAQVLGCATSTVELHVKALLRKAGVESRAALVARFWTLEPA